MSQRAFTARLQVSSDEERAALWRTHRIFNDRLRWVLRQVHRMKRGDSDQRHAEIFTTIETVSDAQARLEAVTSLAWKGGKKGRWRELAHELIADGKLLFDRQRELPGLCHYRFHRRLFEAAFQMIHGHSQLVELWQEEHAKWEAAREKWEQEHSQYMAVRPELQAFEAEHGKSKRQHRWHKWLAFLRSRPDLAAWRGGPAAVHKEDEVASRRIQRAKRNKRDKIRSEEFFNANPDLKELDALHQEYQREYVRPWAKRRHPDGFRHRPTFTEPSAEKHPFWYQLMKNDAYKTLDLETCNLQLRLFVSDEPEPTGRWVPFKFRPDSRIRRLRESAEVVKGGKDEYTLTFSDPALGIDRPAEIRGAKLIFRPARPDGNIYLYFTVDVQGRPCRIRTTQEWCDKYGTEKLRKKIGEELGADPVTCAVDLGIRHLAAATVRRGGKIVRARMIREDDHRGRGPQLVSIKSHKRCSPGSKNNAANRFAGSSRASNSRRMLTTWAKTVSRRALAAS